MGLFLSVYSEGAEDREMNWLARHAVDLWRTLARSYYSRKYRALARHLGRPIAPLEPKQRPGFIALQIDGLSLDHLRLALAQGYMPHVQEMIESGRAQVSQWRCGLPSTTPAVQAGLLYGDNLDIPGFRWYDKEHQMPIVVKRPDQVRALARRLNGDGRGLLHGGSSYTNLFDGDADLSVFTVSTFGRFHFFDNVRGLGFLLLFLLSPVRMARTLYHSARDYARDLARRILHLFRPEPESPANLLAPLYRIVVEVLFGEIETFGMMLDVYRGVRSIYATFSSYDELAHHLGPDHSGALRTLRRMDAQIHQIDRMRQLYRQREYDLYILSDHGMSVSESFQSRYGATLGQFILDSIGKPLSVDEQAEHEAQSSVKARFLLDELQAWEERRWRGPRAARTAHRARASLDRRIPPDVEAAALNLQRRTDVVVRPSGGLAHVYFNLLPHQLSLSEIVWLYPNLTTQLLEHPGIGLVVGREGEEIVVMGKGGTRILADHTQEVKGNDPLCGLADPEAAAVELARLAGFPHSGDLLLLAAWDADGNVITFEDQLGAHGGLGGPQERPFIIHPSDVPLDSHALDSPRDLYVHFMANYVTRNP
jgi:hypothetical protein